VNVHTSARGTDMSVFVHIDVSATKGSLVDVNICSLMDIRSLVEASWLLRVSTSTMVSRLLGIPTTAVTHRWPVPRTVSVSGIDRHNPTIARSHHSSHHHAHSHSSNESGNDAR
jgi:hypothetical protein